MYKEIILNYNNDMIPVKLPWICVQNSKFRLKAMSNASGTFMAMGCRGLEKPHRYTLHGQIMFELVERRSRVGPWSI